MLTKHGRETTDGPAACLDLTGQTEGEAAQSELNDEVDELLSLGVRHLVFDLAGFSRIDSLGLGTMIFLQRTVRRGGGRVCVVHLTRRVHGLLVIPRLLGCFDHFDSEEEAEHSFDLVADEKSARNGHKEGERSWQP